MKPIALTPDQLDAALGLPPTEASCGHPRHERGFGCTHDGCDNDSRQFERPRLDCTCAGRDYGLCPSCAVGT